MMSMDFAARLARHGSEALGRARAGSVGQATDGLLRLRARRLFQRSGLFAALPLTGSVLEVEGDQGHLAEAAVHHIPNRRCVVVDSERDTPQPVDRRVRRRKFHRVCAAPAALPFGDAAFDAAWTTFALARLSPAVQEAALAEMVRVVRPSGLLLAIEFVPETPAQTMQVRLAEAFVPYQPAGPRHYRTASEWRALLSRTGWMIQAEQPFGPGVGAERLRRTFVCRRT